MKKRCNLLIILTLILFNMSCKSEQKQVGNEYPKDNVCVDIETTEGHIVVMLYNETPLHRDNFIKLVKEGYYDGTLFHRVIENFMIQGGDGDSRNAKPGQQLGTGGPGYTVPAEVVFPQCYHKRGALAAARQGDDINPLRASSGSQFYIVTGTVFNAGQLGQLERQMQMQQEQGIFNALVSAHVDEIKRLRLNRDQAGLMALQEQLIAETKQQVAGQGKFAYTQQQRDCYASTGGTPHLDGQYTVFGEVVEGMDVVAKIEGAQTDNHDRPVEDVKVISMKIIE